jgi:hypothetical protein
MSSSMRAPEIERARYTGLSPAAFGASFTDEQGKPRSADWARGLIARGLVAAMDTNPGGKQSRFMIPPSEVARFRKASMVNPELLATG